MTTLIDKITARQIIDSRANPTVEVEIVLNNGIKGTASVPSGASVGKNEALELRDNDSKCLFSKGVSKAVNNVNKTIAKELQGLSPYNQFEIDSLLEQIDGTSNFSKLGANASLGVSMAVSIAAANSLGLELFQYLGGINGTTLPVPMINIINGGVHADNGLNFQEFMIVPIGAKTFNQAMRMSLEVFYSLKNILKKKSLSTNVGDEGGFAPMLNTNAEAIELILEAICAAGYTTDDIKIALDVAASEFYVNKRYNFQKSSLETDEMIDYLTSLKNNYPIVSFEDALAQDDIEGWKKLTSKMECMLVGDDLFTTNPKILKKGIEEKIANSILIKPNQIGTISKTLECAELAKKNCYKTIISHRSGETESTYIADLSVALNSGFIKTGSMSRVDRTAKYNRLLKIEQILNKAAKYSFT